MADRELKASASRRIAIVGGGPAGCAAALTLRRYLPDLPVVLITRTPAATVDAPSVGETLSPGVMPLFDYLGLRSDFLRQGYLPCGGTVSAWGAPQLHERNYLFTGRGNGWHLDRTGFDTWLLEQARQAGVHCIRARATGAERRGDQWRISIDGAPNVLAGAIIEATGRPAWLLRQQDLAPHRHDGLVAEVRWFRQQMAEASAQGALVESVADGWWYSATLPGGRGVVMFMTDKDLRLAAGWDQRLAMAPATRARIDAWEPTGETAIRAANSQCAQSAIGEGWVAAGDTAAAFDPISAMGIGFSLRSGMEAARVAVGAIEDEAAPGAAYADSVERIYADYRSRLQDTYRHEQRWKDQPFWARRQ